MIRIKSDKEKRNSMKVKVHEITLNKRNSFFLISLLKLNFFFR